MEAFLLTLDAFLVYFLVRLVAKIENNQSRAANIGIFAFKEISRDRTHDA